MSGFDQRMTLIHERTAKDQNVRTVSHDVSQKVLQRIVVEIGRAGEGSAGNNHVDALSRTVKTNFRRRQLGRCVTPDLGGDDFAAVRVRHLGADDLAGEERILANAGCVKRQGLAAANVLNGKEDEQLLQCQRCSVLANRSKADPQRNLFTLIVSR